MSKGLVGDEVVLLEAWCQGDKAAGAALFERHYPSIARFFQNKVNEAAQEDLIQETFAACLVSASRFRREANFRAYLFGIAHNVLVDHVRRMGRRNARMVPETDLEEIPAVSLGLSPVASAMHHQEQRLLLEGLRRIPLTHQTALELHYWEELTAVEISEVLGIPLGTAKTRLRDGRAHLEEQLQQIASSPEALRSTLDNLDRWARRVRAGSASEPEAGELPGGAEGAR